MHKLQCHNWYHQRNPLFWGGRFVFQEAREKRITPGSDMMNSLATATDTYRKKQDAYRKYLENLRINNPKTYEALRGDKNIFDANSQKVEGLDESHSLSPDEQKKVLDALTAHVSFYRYNSLIHETQASIEAKKANVGHWDSKLTAMLEKINQYKGAFADGGTAIEEGIKKAREMWNAKMARVSAQSSAPVSDLVLGEYLKIAVSGKDPLRAENIAIKHLEAARAVDTQMGDPKEDSDIEKFVTNLAAEINARTILEGSRDPGSAKKYIEYETDAARKQVMNGYSPFRQPVTPTAGEEFKKDENNQENNDQSQAHDPADLQTRKVRALRDLEKLAIESLHSLKPGDNLFLTAFQYQVDHIVEAQHPNDLQRVVNRQKQNFFSPEETKRLAGSNRLAKRRRDVNIRSF